MAEWTPTPPASDTVSHLANALAQLMASALDEGRVQQLIDQSLKKSAQEIGAALAALHEMYERQLKEANEKAGPQQAITVTVNGVKSPMPEGVLPHSQLEEVLACCSLQDEKGQPLLPNFLLKGHAGTGKTTMAHHLALALGFTEPNQFVAISIVPDMPSSTLMGRVLVRLSDGTETYVPSALIPVILDGGVIFLDEADNADPQILVALNSLTANGFVRLPNGDLIKRHHRCFVGLGMNTNGDGASRQYTRAQLDAAFLDRFVGNTHEIKYCGALERALCPEADIRDAVHSLRRQAEAKGVRRVVSTRFLTATRALVKGRGFTVAKALNACAAL